MTKEEEKAYQDDNKYFMTDDEKYIQYYVRTIFTCIALLFIIVGFQAWELIE